MTKDIKFWQTERKSNLDRFKVIERLKIQQSIRKPSYPKTFERKLSSHTMCTLSLDNRHQVNFAISPQSQCFWVRYVGAEDTLWSFKELNVVPVRCKLFDVRKMRA